MIKTGKSILCRLSETVPFQPLKAIVKKGIIFPFYHTVAFKDSPHIDNLYKLKTPGEFFSDIEFILKHFRTVDFEEAVKLSQSPVRKAKPAFFLSFDDGLSEFYDYIAPYLISKGVPSAVFLNTSFIDNQDMFFRYKASLLIHHFRNNPGLITAAKEYFNNGKVWQGNINATLLNIKYKNRALLDGVAEVTGYSFSGFLKLRQPYLTGSQITGLAKEGVIFGSHSCNHPLFAELSIQEQMEEIVNSMEIVKKYNGKYKLFAFPFTDYGVGNKLFEKIFDSRNPVADYTFGSAGIKDEAFHRHLQRIPMESYNFKGSSLIKTEYICRLLRGIVNKNTIIRH